MKGRLNSTLWTLVTVNAIAFLAVLWMAYRAGSMSHGVGIIDAPSVSGSAGVFLVIAVALCVSAVAFTVFRIANRVLDPVKRLSDFAERLAQGDYRTRATVDSADDFGFIAEQLNRAAENSSRAVF